MKFQVATSNSPSGPWEDEDFVGPGGTSSSYYTVSGQPIWPGHIENRYIRYKACLTTTIGSITPALDSITITYVPKVSRLITYNNVIHPKRDEKVEIIYVLAKPGVVTLKIYNMNGELVKTLIDNEYKDAGGSEDWYGLNADGDTVASGIYLVHIESPGLRSTKKVAVIK